LLSPSAETRLAEQYHEILREQPGNSYLFDRFYNAGLASGTPEQLEARLIEALAQSDQSDPSDQSGQSGQSASQADRLLLALFYEKQGRDLEALEHYRAGATPRPLDAEFLYYKARAESRHLAFDTAIADLLQARELAVTGAVAENASKLLGELYIRTHQKEKAAALWKELLAAGQENLGLYDDLIELQIKEGLFDDALATSEEVLAATRDPHQAVVRRLRFGDIYLYQGEQEKALLVYSEALNAVGQGSWLETQICSQIEQVFKRVEDRDGLMDHLKGLIGVHPQRMSLKKRLATLLVKAGRTDEGLDLFEQILKAAPGDKGHQMAYIQTLAAAGVLDKAITVMEQLCQ
jgi:tetratricopeptide (TPR) repeat protein